ncbi:Nuclear pore complex protein [Tetrabaena socialis]|uniref:Nuclear pore complex protein n=1 Tax=Tetrabaena socialis TaxID=47790 RepID=A0A2J8AJ08_9CHLO|nr:Nuclear pore complex protein [Tetrabaena socialis]|eukprot:PNH12494.1 Nuclear pore complex protein [Tetrabaena socialis]
MDIDLPGGGLGQQTSLEEELATAFTNLLGDSRGAKDIVGDIYSICHERAEEFRCARVVSWLEFLADDSLKRQGGTVFAPGEGLWQETKTEMRAGTGSVVTELDPDAPGRLGRPLHPSNARSQERILARVWQLLRAGRLPEALELCQQVGQPWRAAALGGGGPYGPVPVGATAAEHDEHVGEELQAEELADEVSHGSGTLLALWRWAALQAAAAAPAGGDKFERAVFGALGGSSAAAAAACSSWEDFAWAYCRCVFAVMRCAALRLSLVALGEDAEAPAAGPQLLEMLAAPPDAMGAGAGSAPEDLLGLLTQSQLQHVLAVEADTVVQHLRNCQQRR